MSPLARLLVTLSALFVAMWIHAGTLDVRGDTGAFDASCPTAMAGDDDDERRMTPSAMADDGDGDDDDSLASDDDPGDGPEAIPVQHVPERLVEHAPRAARSPRIVHLDTETPPPRA